MDGIFEKSHLFDFPLQGLASFATKLRKRDRSWGFFFLFSFECTSDVATEQVHKKKDSIVQ